MASSQKIAIPLKPKGEKRRVSFNIVNDLGIVDPGVVLPALYMQHNPQTWSQTYQKLTTRYQTFGGYVEEYWGEDLDTITASATTGGFILESEGYTTYNRKQTRPYFKFQDVLDIYKNNGNTYDSNANIVKKGGIIIFFDPGTYLGYFESLTYAEDANNPYRFTFDFTFKVRKSFTGI
ncbi:hypothetical protein N9948_01405 [bacterium]|nr:hypothetical protein [bacterium]